MIQSKCKRVLQTIKKSVKLTCSIEMNKMSKSDDFLQESHQKIAYLRSAPHIRGGVDIHLPPYPYPDLFQKKVGWKGGNRRLTE